MRSVLAGVPRKEELIVVAFGRRNLCHVLVGKHPIVVVVARADPVPVPTSIQIRIGFTGLLEESGARDIPMRRAGFRGWLATAD